jgi:multiple sugar transport system permease protein
VGFLKKISLKSREAVLFYVLVSPFILSFVLLKIFPMVYAMYISFTNATGFNWDHLRFVNFKNYARILQDQEVLYSAGRTVLIAIVYVPLQMIAINLVALLLTRNIKGVGFFRTVYYIPSIVPAVAGGMMWLQLYNKNFGFFNQILGQFGITVNWLGYEWVTASLIFMMIWGLGTGLLISIAAIKNVPRELYEAAEIDGAKSFSQFVRITLPLITPVNLYNLLMGIIGAMQIYAQPVLITPAGVSGGSGILGVPLKPNYLYVVHIYQQIFAKQRFGYGLALIWVLFIVVVGLTLLVLRTSRNWVHYEVDQEGGGRS